MFSSLFRRHSTIPLPDERLLGTWQSNRAMTVETIRPSLRFASLEKQERFFAVFGELHVTFTATTVRGSWPRRPPFTVFDFTTGYKVTASSTDSITLRYDHPPIRSPKIQVLRFVNSNCFWIDLSREIHLPLDTTDWREYFERVTLNVT